MKKYYSLVGIALSMLLSLISARGENVRIISYHSLPKLVEQNNLALRIAHAQVGVAKGQLQQSGRLSNPELSVALGGNTEFDEGGLEIGFSQQFPITNRLSLEKGFSQTLLRASELEIEVVKRELLRDARQRYSALYYLREKSLVLKEQQKTLEELGRFVDQAVSQAQLSSLDSTKIKIESLKFKTELNEIEASIAKESHSLKLLLGINPAEEVASQSLQNLLRKMSSETASLMDQYTVWQETADNIQNEIIPEVQGQVAELKEAYQKGQSELNSVFRAQEQLLSLRTTYLEAMQKAYDLNIQLQFYTQ